MPTQRQHTNWLHNTPPSSHINTRRMSLLSLPPHIHSTSPPLHDDEMRQVEEYLLASSARQEALLSADIQSAEMYLADQQAIDAAEHARLLDYLADAAAPPVPDAISALAENMRLLAVPEDDEEELDTHSCGDSECQGEHVHADEGDYYGISPSYSPNHTQYNYYEQPYIPDTPPYD